MTDKTPKSTDAPASQDGSRLSAIYEAAETYGIRSFDNYAQIRSVAETLRDLLCKWLHKGDERCVYLVPPEGPFEPQNYQSGAFSVSGTGYLPLQPISFGLAIRISEDKDFMRLKLHCQKEGELMKISIGKESRPIPLQLPLDETQLTPLLASKNMTKVTMEPRLSALISIEQVNRTGNYIWF